MRHGRKPGKKAVAERRIAPQQLEPGRPPEPVAFRKAPRPQNVPQSCYVYGVIESRSPVMFGKSSIGGLNEDVYTVHEGALAAVVSRTPALILDPTRDNALAHEHVLETVMRSHTVIPMSFGTVFRSDEDVRAMLQSIRTPLEDVLRQMAGKVEFGLKVTWDRDRIMEQLKNEHEEIRLFHQELTNRRLQSTYFARLQLGRMIDQAMAELAAGCVHDIYHVLRPLSAACRDSKLIGDRMIMNASFLVRKEREAEFDAAVDRLAQKLGDRLTFKLTGPWPAYNSVNIRLKLEMGKTG